MIPSASNSSPCANDASLFRIGTTNEETQKQKKDKKLFILSCNIVKHIHIHKISKQTKCYKVYVGDFT